MMRPFQVSFVVSDLVAAKAAGRLLGTGEFLALEGLGEVNETYRGAPSGPSVLAVAIAQLGDLQLELVQFTSGESTISEFVSRHGTGLHHIGFKVDSEEEFDRLEPELGARGMPVRQSGRASDGTRYSYLDAEDTLGCYVLIVYPGEKLSAFYQRLSHDGDQSSAP
jgi:hypothetical protein